MIGRFVRMIGGFLGLLLITPIRLYQRFISPMRPPTCRFYPSCSAYAVKAITIHGPFVGSYLAIRRLLRCHPWTPGGVDEVPPQGRWREIRPPYDPTESDASATRSVTPNEHASSLIPRPRRVARLRLRTFAASSSSAIQGA
jgi:uncharacterized protein